MSNPVAEQLATLRMYLERAGWNRASAGVWCLNGTVLRTGYVWGEATVVVDNVRTPDQSQTYRGAQPLTWFLSSNVSKLEKILSSQLDTETGTE